MTRKQESTNTRDIYGELKAMINNLEILPGTRVTEHQLADYFEVSRTPVRAALHKLENDNLLSIKPKQGCFIRNIDMGLISNYYDVRVTLENMVLQEVSRQHDMSGLDKLKKDWDPEYHRFGVKTTDKLKQAEEAFHIRLCELSHNPALQNYITDINHKIRCVRLLG
jgi:DNA-binding GntR family transcriptional regulator